MVKIFSQYISSKSIALAALESIIITLTLLIAVRVNLWRDPAMFVKYTVQECLLHALICAGVVQVCLYYSDFYDVRAVKRTDEKLICIGQSIGAACVVLAVVYYVFPALFVRRGVVLVSMSFVGVAIIVSRLALDTAWRVAAPVANVAIVGTGGFGLKVANELLSRDDLSLRVRGIITAVEQPSTGSIVCGDHSVPVLGSIGELQDIVTQNAITRIVVASDEIKGEALRDLIRLRVQGLGVEHAHTTIAGLTGKVWLEAVPSTWFLFSSGFRRSKSMMAAKRMFDILFSVIGFILAAPIMALVAVGIRLDSRGPVIYRQIRVGYKGRPFEVLKFRSMRVDAEAVAGACWAQERDPRVSRLGGTLRKYRLDELPQFINVIRGDMSFVGPRPERPVFVEKLRVAIPFYDERHMVRPGLTGWAQVEYQYGSTVAHAAEKLEYDLFYMMNMSFLFDCAIVLKTVRTLISGRGSR